MHTFYTIKFKIIIGSLWCLAISPKEIIVNFQVQESELLNLTWDDTKMIQNKCVFLL